MNIRIGTRKSRLAIIQTETVKTIIKEHFPDISIELVPMSTLGDKVLDRPLTQLGGKGVFTKEIEQALLDNEIDMAVHSAKDMPMELLKGLSQGAVFERIDSRDVIVTISGVRLEDMPAGAVIGTSSLRREIQVKKVNPKVIVKSLRGNVETRIKKLKDGEYDGIVLAAAGLKRLGFDKHEDIRLENMSPETFVPAPGQGTLCVEIRTGEFADIMKAINSKESEEMLYLERRFLKDMNASCNAPCGAYCRYETGSDKKKMYYVDTMYADDMQVEYKSGCFDTLKEAEHGVDAIAASYMLKTVSLVGAGPGEAKLITRKGLECVQRADVIIYDNLVATSILNEASLSAELIYAGKTSSVHHLKQDEINTLIVKNALEGKYVVRLKGGDPFIFGRGAEEAMELKSQGIPFEIVPGISSAYSVPEYAGIPVTERNMASSFHVITGHEGKHKSEQMLDYALLAKEEGTLIFLMGLSNLCSIAKQLQKYGKSPDTPAAVISKGTTANQKKITGTLSDIYELAKKENIQTPAVIVIGDVVSLNESLEWIKQGPLIGKRVMITGTRNMVKQLSDMLEAEGAETVACSLIETCPMGEVLYKIYKNIEKYTWIVFTSGNGVNIFFDYLKKDMIDYRKLANVKFAAIGENTGKAILDNGFKCDFIPSEYTSESMVREWIPLLKKSDDVLLIHAASGSDRLSMALEHNGINFYDAGIYDIRKDTRRKEELNRIVSTVDYITFASGSAAEAFTEMCDDIKNISAVTVAIGPETEKKSILLGLGIDITAEVYTAKGMLDAIINDAKTLKYKEK